MGPRDDPFAEHHRLLAYLAPWFTGSASDPLPPRDDPQRRTFNLDMVEAGWGALSVGAGFIVRMGSPGRLPFLETATRSEPREAAIAQAYGSDAGTVAGTGLPLLPLLSRARSSPMLVRMTL